ncbi:MAG: flagellar basal body-associated FliL family protein [Nitrospirae bacterium]|nr:flagellar basal body-associated FliL family protein [Nitrospirota bacterium]
MADEDDAAGEGTQGPDSKKSKASVKLIIIVVGILLIVAGGGFFAYTKLMGKKDGAGHEGSAGHEASKKQEEGPPVLVALDPFVVNLVDNGRYMKVTIQVELASKHDEANIKDRVPQLRDAILFLLSGKSLESVSGSEGKLQLKEEMLFKLNQTIGSEVIKSVYFTDFVVQ